MKKKEKKEEKYYTVSQDIVFYIDVNLPNIKVPADTTYLVGVDHALDKVVLGGDGDILLSAPVHPGGDHLPAVLVGEGAQVGHHPGRH